MCFMTTPMKAADEVLQAKMCWSVNKVLRYYKCCWSFDFLKTFFPSPCTLEVGEVVPETSTLFLQQCVSLYSSFHC